MASLTRGLMYSRGKRLRHP